MKTSFSKKLLAYVLSLCMILTVCAGALSVSAAVAGTATIYETVVEPGETTADVTVEIVADEAIGGSDLFITVPDIAEITKVDIQTDGYDITFSSNGTDVSATAGTPADVTVDVVDGVAQFVILANGDFVGDTTVTIILTFEGEFADTYPVEFAEGTLIGTTDETAIDAELVNGAIVAHVHDYEAVVTPPTCTEEGYTTYTCECGDEYTADVVDALGHTPADAVVENNVAPDCDTAGSYDSVIYCSVCGEEISRDTITVDATGHTPGDAVVENNVAPDCVNTGSYDSVVYCTVCNAEISRETVTVDALGHTAVVDAAVAPTCTETGLTEGSHCSVCGEVIVAQEVVAALGHTPGDPVNNGDGTHTIACTVCSEVIETVEHTYTDGSCVCGATEPVSEPVLDENLQFSSVVVTVTSSVNIRYRIRKTTNDSASGYKTLGYDHVEIVASGKKYSSVNDATLYNEVDIPETLVPNTASTSAIDTFTFQGIAMNSLGLDINAYIKAYDAEGNFVAYSPVTTSSPALLLKTLLAETVTDEGKASIIELLNMAAAAQVHFGAVKSGTDLANAVAEGKLVNKDLPASIVTDIPSLNVVDNTVNWSQSVEDSFKSAHKITTNAVITEAPNIRVYVGGRSSLDASKLRVEFSYYDPNPTVKDTVTKTVEAVNANISGARLAFDVPSFEFHNVNQTVTATVYYDGNQIATVQYSIETYVSGQLNDPDASQTAKDLNAAIAKFGLAFRLNKGIKD